MYGFGASHSTILINRGAGQNKTKEMFLIKNLLMNKGAMQELVKQGKLHAEVKRIVAIQSLCWIQRPYITSCTVLLKFARLDK